MRFEGSLKGLTEKEESSNGEGEGGGYLCFDLWVTDTKG